MVYTVAVVDLEWDAANEGHIARHGVTPEEVEEALTDPRRIGAPAYSTEGERRWALLGATGDRRVRYVVYTRRGDRLRVVTARDATALQRRRYRR
jgi:uncharacterized DUF497 family protein